jgi:hypothetical protein
MVRDISFPKGREGVRGNRGFPLYSGYIMEILIYDRILSDSERKKVEGYLAKKWNFQSRLPTNHPYYLSASTTNPTMKK